MAQNFYSCSKSDTAGEIFLTLHQDARVKIERIASHGQASPEGFWYDQPEDEWVMLAQGEAVIAYANGTQRKLRAGDQVFIPRHLRHRVAHASLDALWLAVHIADR